MNFTERTQREGSQSCGQHLAGQEACVHHVYQLPAHRSHNGEAKAERWAGSVSPMPPKCCIQQIHGGVDRCDQLRGYYRLRTKSKKFYRYVFWFLFDCCIVNAFTLVKHYCPITVSNRQAVIKDFRQQLALGLIGQYNTRKRYALPAPIREAASDCAPPPVKRRAGATPQGSEGHFPIKGPTARCHWCWNYKKHRRHESAMHCRKCGKAFCLVSRDGLDGPSCFERYHTSV